MTQHLKEQERIRKQKKHSRWQIQEIKKADEGMQKGLRQILCRRMPHCKKNGKINYCFYCTSNKTHLTGPQVKNYFEPKIPGMKFL